MRMENGQQQTRPAPPTRSSTVGSPGDFERNRLKGNNDIHPHARSEDLNHSSHSYNQHMLSDGMNGNELGSSPTGSPMPSFQSLSRPLTPNDSHSRSGASSSAHSDHGVPGDDTTLKRMSTASLISGLSSTAASTSGSKAGSSVSATTTLVMTTCAACSLPLEGAFVRALGNVWHLNCFKCRVRSIRYDMHSITDLPRRTVMLLLRPSSFPSMAPMESNCHYVNETTSDG